MEKPEVTMSSEELTALQADLDAPCTDLEDAQEILEEYGYVELTEARTFRDSDGVLWTFETDEQLLAHVNQEPTTCPSCGQLRIIAGATCGLCAKGIGWQDALKENIAHQAAYHGWPVDASVCRGGGCFVVSIGWHTLNSATEILATEEAVSAYLREHGIDPESGWRRRCDASATKGADRSENVALLRWLVWCGVITLQSAIFWRWGFTAGSLIASLLLGCLYWLFSSVMLHTERRRAVMGFLKGERLLIVAGVCLFIGLMSFAHAFGLW